jgi:ribose transport system ATP-binding protein
VQEQPQELPIVRIENVTKKFPGVVALRDVSFNVRRGEIHGIVGENGAGKSTLIKAIMGVHQLDGGAIYINNNGDWIQPKNALDAKRLGLYANYQNVNIANNLSVGENYFLGRLPIQKFGIVNWPKIFKESKMVLEKFHLDHIDPRTNIDSLPISVKEMITISKISMYDDLQLAIFDEPTAFFENERVDELFRYIEKLKNDGISIIYISHRLEEITQICDRVTVLKDGEYVSTRDISDIDKDALISMMVGRKIEDIYDINHQKPGKEILRVEGLTKKGKYKDISFSIAEGEILGFFGLIGSGRSDVMKAVYGAEKADSGEIFVHQKKAVINSPIESMKKGIGLIPEERGKEGVALDLSVKININLNSYDMISHFGVINVRKEKTRTNHFIDAIKIKTPSIEQKVANLSGGNQQKIVISKLLCRDLDLLIFDEPTVGVDVGAKQEIYQLIGRLAEEGKAIIVISSYLPEILGISDRVVIMAEGEKVSEINRWEKELWNEEEALKFASKQSTLVVKE